MTYQQKKNVLRQEAINWQLDFNKQSMYYSELIDYSNYFCKQAKRYGLINEFRENGII